KQPSSPKLRNCGCASRNPLRPEASAMPMMPLPSPNVQKSSNALWPAPSICQKSDGAGTATNASCEIVGATTWSADPERKKLGLSGADGGAMEFAGVELEV